MNAAPVSRLTKAEFMHHHDKAQHIKALFGLKGLKGGALFYRDKPDSKGIIMSHRLVMHFSTISINFKDYMETYEINIFPEDSVWDRQVYCNF